MWNCRNIGLLICTSTSCACQKWQWFASTYCRSCVGKWRGSNNNSRTLEADLHTVDKFPDALHAHKAFSNFLPLIILKQINTDFTDHLKAYTDCSFSGNGSACENSRYLAVFFPMWPGNEARGVSALLHVATSGVGHS